MTAKQRMRARNLARRKAHYRRERVNQAGMILFWLGILFMANVAGFFYYVK